MSRYTADEFSLLDHLRGTTPRGVWCREASLQQAPQPPAPKFPQVNRDVWAELAQGPMSNMHQIKYEAERLRIAYPEEDAKWKFLSEQYDELIRIAHQVRDGLLTVISN